MNNNIIFTVFKAVGTAEQDWARRRRSRAECGRNLLGTRGLGGLERKKKEEAKKRAIKYTRFS